MKMSACVRIQVVRNRIDSAENSPFTGHSPNEMSLDKQTDRQRVRQADRQRHGDITEQRDNRLERNRLKVLTKERAASLKFRGMRETETETDRQRQRDRDRERQRQRENSEQ